MLGLTALLPRATTHIKERAPLLRLRVHLESSNLREVALHYASLNVMRILPIELPCSMDAFGIIRQQGHLLAPGAELLLR